MKKILVTLSMVCFIGYISNAQTTPVAAAKETKKDAVKTEAATTAAPEAKKSGCCHKGMSMADCKNKSAKCATKSADTKAQKSNATGGNN